MQNNKVVLLSIAKLTLNIKILDIIKVTIFFINFGKELNLFKKSENNRLV